MKIVLNKNKTEAMVHYESHSVMLYHSDGLVLDLIAVLLAPIGCNVHSMTQVLSSLDDTQSINLSQIETEKVA